MGTAGIDLETIAGRLEDEGVAAFAGLFAAVIAESEARRRFLAEHAATWAVLGRPRPLSTRG